MENPRDQRELVVRAQWGDVRAVGELVEGHRAVGQRIAFRMVGDSDVVADIVQDAAVEVLRSIRQLRDPDRFSSWFCGIILNLCRGYLRNRSRLHETSLDVYQGGLQFEAIDFASTEPDPADAVIEKEIRDRVVQAVRELPAPLQAPALLYYFQHLTLREIAAGMGITVGNVKIRLHRARLRLRERLMATGPVSAAIHNEMERRRVMVRVRVFDVLHRIQRGEAGSDQKAPSVVVLVDEPMERTLPVWMGRVEAAAIALAMRNKTTPRPLTASFVATLLHSARVEVKEARIARLEDKTYYAEVEIVSAGRPSVVDARPSDAIALATYAGAAVFVADEIMQRASFEIPREAGRAEPQPQGIEEVLAEVEQRFRPASDHVLAREEADLASRDLVQEVFGAQV